MSEINMKAISELILEGYIVKRPHPSGELFIYNYTAKAQYDRRWTPETMMCRGLILDKDNQIVARPLSKFFNLQESEEALPTGSFDVYEKFDGSLGISYWFEGKLFIASRGSFSSDQAVKANELIHSLYPCSAPLMDRNSTYCFEIIYPSNRIVVNYGDYEALVLLAVINMEDGSEYPIEDSAHLGFPLAKKHNGLDEVNTITGLNTANEEGFVLRFANGLRLKFKFEDYVRLHRVLTQMTTKVIWEMLRDKVPFEEVLERVPDEFYDWVRKTKESLEAEYQQIENEAVNEFERVLGLLGRSDRRILAEEFKDYKHSAILFRLLDKKDYSEYIWKMIRPACEKPFSQEGLDRLEA